MKYRSLIGKKRYKCGYANQMMYPKLYRAPRLSGYTYGSWKVEASFGVGYGKDVQGKVVYGFTPLTDSISELCKQDVFYRSIYVPFILYSKSGKEKIDKLNGLYDEMRVYATKIRWKPLPKDKQTNNQNTVGIFYFDDGGSEGGFVNSYDNGIKSINHITLPNADSKRFIWINLKDRTGGYATASALLKTMTGAYNVCGLNDVVQKKEMMTNVMGEIAITLYLRCRKKN